MYGDLRTSNEYNEREVRLNRIAYKLKFTEITEGQRQMYHIELFEGLVALIKRTSGFLRNIDRTWTEQEGLWITVLTDAYMSSMERYGTIDEDSGNIIPYVKVFRAHLEFAIKNNCRQAPDRSLIELDNPQSKAREGLAKQILRQYALKNMVSNYVLPKRIRNRNLFKDELIKLGVDESEAIALMNEVFSGNNFCTFEDNLQEDGSSTSREYVIEKITVLLGDITIPENKKKYIKYYVTKEVYRVNLSNHFEYRDIIDEDYLRELNTSREDATPSEILGLMLGLSSDTVRKNLKVAENIIRHSERRK